MKKKSLKTLLFASVVVIVLGGVAYKQVSSPSFAAPAGHGEEHADEEKHGHDEESGHKEGGENEGLIKLDAAQIEAAGIKVVEAGPRNLAREVTVPGKVISAADRMAQIVPKVGGTVTQARKNLGDTVEKGEVMALIESHDIAEAVAEHLAAKRSEELAKTVFIREKKLWDKKITAEQDYLSAKNAHQEATIKLDLTRQKLQTLGHEGMVGAESRFYEMKSPLAGRVIAREVMLGEYVDTTHSAYTVADLSIVWVETAIAPGDLPFVKEGQSANVSGNGGKGEGKLIFVSPVIDPETRAAKAIIALDNANGQWRPGEFTNANIATGEQKAELVIPKEALQTIDGKNVIFVRTAEGFEKRDVVLGREDSKHAEIMSGLKAGEPVAVTGTFTLKAELGKSEAEHEH